MADEHLDPHGFPIDMDRPVVFKEGSLEPNTELSITAHSGDLGLPGDSWYNVPSIWDGKHYDPRGQFNDIAQRVQQAASQGYKFPNFPNLDEAEKAAGERSKYLGELKRQQIEQAIQQQRQKLMLEMFKQEPKLNKNVEMFKDEPMTRQKAIMEMYKNN